MSDTRWLKVRTAERAALVAIEDNNGTFDTILTGFSDVRVDGIYDVRIAGTGTIRSRGHEYNWDGAKLVDVGTGLHVTPGTCVYVNASGQAHEEMPFE